MGFLDQISSGVIHQNDFILVYGIPKVGKTTFACDFENSIIMDIEDGSKNLNVKRGKKIEHFKEIIPALGELLVDKHIFKTIVVDSLDSIEAMINKCVCEENGWKAVEDGAFGKGYAAAQAKWIELVDQLKKLREKMNVVLIAHSTVKQVNDPMKNSAYDRHEIKLRDKAAALFKESVDAILYCTYEYHTKEAANGKVKAIGDGSRIMYTQSRPAHEGGNRYGLPYKLALSYSAYREARESAGVDEIANLKKIISEGIAELKEPDLKEKVSKALAKAKDNKTDLEKIQNRLSEILANAV